MQKCFTTGKHETNKILPLFLWLFINSKYCTYVRQIPSHTHSSSNFWITFVCHINEIIHVNPHKSHVVSINTRSSYFLFESCNFFHSPLLIYLYEYSTYYLSLCSKLIDTHTNTLSSGSYTHIHTHMCKYMKEHKEEKKLCFIVCPLLTNHLQW